MVKKETSDEAFNSFSSRGVSLKNMFSKGCQTHTKQSGFVPMSMGWMEARE